MNLINNHYPRCIQYPLGCHTLNLFEFNYPVTRVLEWSSWFRCCAWFRRQNRTTANTNHPSNVRREIILWVSKQFIVSSANDERCSVGLVIIIGVTIVGRGDHHYQQELLSVRLRGGGMTSNSCLTIDRHDVDEANRCRFWVCCDLHTNIHQARLSGLVDPFNRAGYVF